MSLPINQIICGECSSVMSEWPDNTIDLIVTSPPYDNTRTYYGYEFDFEAIAQQLYRVTKDGGVVVWVVDDGSLANKSGKSGNSFKQALYFKEIGFNLHDTMIWNKNSFNSPGMGRYHNVFEYMFIFSKNRDPITFNPINDRKTLKQGTIKSRPPKRGSGKIREERIITIGEFGRRYNLWTISVTAPLKTGHSATFPLQLVQDHIYSWSNEGDIVLDPFMGSGTTALAAIKLNRNYIGIEISQEYCDLARERISKLKEQITIFD